MVVFLLVVFGSGRDLYAVGLEVCWRLPLIDVLCQQLARRGLADLFLEELDLRAMRKLLDL